MPRVTRGRTVAAEPGRVWGVVSEPRSLTQWWPGVERVEEASPEAWTKVLRSRRGNAIRADFTLIAAERPSVLAWRQELHESPFERFMSEATTRVSIEPAAEGKSRVELHAVRRLRGLARLGWPLVRRATRRQLDEALAGLAELVADPRRPARGRR